MRLAGLSPARGLVFLLIALAAGLCMAAVPARAQQQPCPPTQENLVKIPEIVTDGQGHLRGTIQLIDQQELVPYRIPLGGGNVPGGANTKIACLPQFMRAYQVGGMAAASGLANPLPGPTLRARVGDIVELTFLNQINPADFGNSIDQDLVKGGSGCDQVSGIYPPTQTKDGKTTPVDIFPNCFHGSSTANIHYHGTHTNPNSTGDNVLVEVRPSNAQQDTNPVTATTYKQDFDAFFANCEAMLKDHPRAEWPTKWSDLPDNYTNDQKARLIAYDNQSGQNLWGSDDKALQAGTWPLYYVGAYPYCFQLPQYDATSWPPPDGGNALQMGQAPGTHWYHAHKHGSTSIDVSNGMSGVFIIEGAYDDALNAYYNATPNWTRSQPVLLVNQIGTSPNLEHPGNGQTDKGPNFSVNGRLEPTIHMYPGEVQMWRIANSSSRSAMYLPALPPGFTWHQLAQDGVQLTPDNYEKSGTQPDGTTKPLNIASGNRVDLLVQAPSTASGQPVAVQVLPNVARAEVSIVPDAKARRWPTSLPPPVNLLWVDVSGQGSPMQLIPKDKLAPLPPYLADITDGEVAGHTQNVTYASNTPLTPRQHTIDGYQFSETDQSGWIKIDKLDTAQEWTVVNETSFQPIDHPFHIHINPFQITQVFDPNQVITPQGTTAPVYKYVFDSKAQLLPGQCYVNPLDKSTWKPCDDKPSAQRVWWDTFPIPSGRAATGFVDKDNNPIVVAGHFIMRTRLVDFPGIWVTHCHILAHEDRGMMTVVSVAASQQALANVCHH
ncbi:MAG TPA: multicopper oxidase domain-containing protein [Stellaceae bacterium]|jgi:FtsP/CotA-like multicopper oxidase with cupredoxin domain|nr:multicopper oxidase domain-containing protein [Stellaceae bacterium]